MSHSGGIKKLFKGDITLCCGLSLRQVLRPSRREQIRKICRPLSGSHNMADALRETIVVSIFCLSIGDLMKFSVFTLRRYSKQRVGI